MLSHSTGDTGPYSGSGSASAPCMDIAHSVSHVHSQLAPAVVAPGVLKSVSASAAPDASPMVIESSIEYPDAAPSVALIM